MKLATLFASALTLVACASDEDLRGPQGAGRPGDDPNAAASVGDGGAAAGATTGPNALPPARIGVMGEAEIAEFFIKQLEMADGDGVLPLVNYIPINDNTAFEHHSFSADVRRVVRWEYQNTMPSSREAAVFSQTTASGFFSLGSRVCVMLFNRDIARPSRKALFGVDDFNDPAITPADRERIVDVLIDRFVMTSVVDVVPVRADVKKVVLELMDESVASGMSPRDSLEEGCAVLLGSLAPYLL